MSLRWILAVLIALSAATGAQAQETQGQPTATPSLVGPVNAVFPSAGEPIRKELAEALPPGAPWVVAGWIRLDRQSGMSNPIATLVDKSGATVAEIGVSRGAIYVGGGARRAVSHTRAKAGEWLPVSVAATGAGITLTVGSERPVRTDLESMGTPIALVLAPKLPGSSPFTGAVAYFEMWSGSVADTPRLGTAPPNEELIEFESGSPTWPLQVKQFMGLTEPQDPATLPTSRSTEPAKRTAAGSFDSSPLSAKEPGRWTVGAWRFIAEPETDAKPASISSPGFDARSWLPATVPGTVLTSYVDNGVYPDPAYGLNNMQIPERLNRQDYWFRAEFDMPEAGTLARRALEFLGINYASEIWINGERSGFIAGAFTRGRFSLPPTLRPGDRVAVAVKVSPPPHPSLPHEESLKAGPGQNGGAMALDGPTFAASQGWDWIPSVRDRNTGIWQDVVLEATGPVRIGDPQVRTVLPRADNSVAELTFDVPVENGSDEVADVSVEVRFANVSLNKTLRIPARSTVIARFDPGGFEDLRIDDPVLWWPNGYGAPTLHDLALTAKLGDMVSDTKTIRFGIREITYELSLVDKNEDLRRVSVAPARGSGEQLLAVDHEHIRKVAGGWALSLAKDVADSPALTAAPETPLAPHLLLRVNGVQIAVRGGNWGMDDWLKRVSRERLEPYFRLHREANANTIRNWMGQNTEEVFFDLADEYGLLVINDFWISTQDHNGEPGDSALFLANTADTISHFRHHPSIALWIGRNEGVPPPTLNIGFEKLVRELDGTRAYLPNSRQIHTANSGPWNYQQPENYFTRHARGFSTEVGTPSFPTLASFKAMMPTADRWPISDSWAYHDWHQGKAGDVAPFMKELGARFGGATSLADFEKKAQVLNYEAHRAVFEGMNDGLFTRNSGRLLWMTHPAWPSTQWQIYSHDYDTQASYFGFRKGTEPVHIQMNLPDRTIAVVNSLPSPIAEARVRVRNFDLDGMLLDESESVLDAPFYTTTATGPAFAPSLFNAAPVVLTKLELFDSAGALLSENLYWQAREPAAYRLMREMKQAKLAIAVEKIANSDENEIRATIANLGSAPALMTKLSLLDAAGARILPAYWSDNYVSLLAGERRVVTIKSPASAGNPHTVAVDGWNVEPASAIVAEPIVGNQEK